jgi:hypothetical protein
MRKLGVISWHKPTEQAMSKHEEERGSLILPSAEVVNLRNALTTAVNTRRAQAFELAEKIHARLQSPAGAAQRKAIGAILRGKTRQGTYDLFWDLLEAVDPTKRSHYGYDIAEEPMLRETRCETIMRLLIAEGDPAKGTKPRLRAPRKKDLPLLLNSKTWAWSGDEFRISINPKTRVLHWNVERNKRAVEEAHEHLLGKTLFSALAKMKWTRGTGGVFIYSDEYMADAAMDGNGSAVSRTPYGPLGEQECELHLPRRPARKAPKR